MKNNKTILITTLLVLSTLPLSAETTIEVIKAGETLHLGPTQTGYEPQTTIDGALELKTQGANPSERFPINVRIGSHFKLKARLAVDNVRKSAAGIFFNGKLNGADQEASFFFEGADQTLWVFGFLFKDCKDINYERVAPDAVLNGEFFDLEIDWSPTSSEKSSFDLRINGETIVATTAPTKLIEWLSLSPARAVLLIQSLTLSGDVVVEKNETQFVAH